ncbi:amino acid permease [Bifidobacterium dolichotidis]|uniref:Amino acid permease n=1 Tax=Bifidobacterium dolichotidis TaxID=2306976 RepID=A0A430FQ77_9BIFI|nr:amino acid permease [Bifidobacterium dolichotidis]RSX54993.1 amino acid permease [Bifidobacterium dolichotidis]
MADKPKSTSGAAPGIAKVSTLAFVGMTCALCVSIRNIPDVASTGWTMFFYMLVATLLFGFPISLIAGEFTTTFPGAGGPELWDTKSLSPRWGFVTSWLLWVQMFPGMVMVASVLAPLVGYAIGNVALGMNNVFTLVCILVVYWAVTLLNMRFDMAKIGGKIGIWLGLYIPIVAMFILGLAAVIKTGGFSAGSTLGTFSGAKLVPDGVDWSSLTMFSTIIFIFTGIEMSSVYVERLQKPDKQYPIGVFISLLLMFVFNVANAFLVAAVVPKGQMQLNNITQAVAIYVDVLGLPHWFVNAFAILVFLGVVVQLSGWVSGPSQTITASARRGEYPSGWKFWKTNKFGLSTRVLIVQAVIISVFALVYLLIPAVNTAFLMLVNATSVLYCIVYVLMAIGIMRLRKTQPTLARPFRIGKTGNGLCYFIAIVLLAVIVLVNGLVYATSSVANNIVVTIVSIVLFVIPLFIFAHKKPAWETDVRHALLQQGVNLAEDGTIDGVTAGEHAKNPDPVEKAKADAKDQKVIDMHKNMHTAA